MRTRHQCLMRQDDERIREELRQAYDFDPRDPLFGLSRTALCGPRLDRRTTLRLLAAAGTLSAWHLMPGAGVRHAAAQAGGELNAGWAGVGEIRTIDPAQINQVLQFQISSNVLSGLTHINKDLAAEGDLAEDWTVSDDGKEWTFNLREGVTFHNGDPFTAEDVVFTYNRSKDPEQSIHAAVISNVVDVVAEDDHTVRIVLAAPQASFLTKTLERSSGRAMTIVSDTPTAVLPESRAEPLLKYATATVAVTEGLAFYGSYTQGHWKTNPDSNPYNNRAYILGY